MIQSALKLVDVSANPERFFKELPSAWKNEAREIWPKVSSNSQIFILVEGGEFRGGGIVSLAVFPDMTVYETKALSWYAKKFYYVGFLYVPAQFRSNGYGSIWLNEIRNAVPAKGFWLSIEKIGLLKFYARSGFHLEQIIGKGKATEWLLVSPREDW
jgi:GNAT superfamily N-acetyltransferase